MTSRKKVKLESQLEDRKRNLRVVQEAIDSDGRNGQQLVPVREFLNQRIATLESELDFKKY
jgi:hypothetical protein